MNKPINDELVQSTEKIRHELKGNAPEQAVILAAGLGMRMVPINNDIPKGLLEINGETLIERLIKQLHQVGVKQIYVVVGYMREKFEYLISKYNVKLIFNSEFATKNNLHSLKLALDYLSNSYVVPCDIWCRFNPFNHYELNSWYMVSDLVDDESTVRVNRKMELMTVPEGTSGNSMIGICYLTSGDAKIVCNQIKQFSNDIRYDNAFWEESLYSNGKMFVKANVVHVTDVVEINTYEQLRDLDSNSKNLKSDSLEEIGRVLNIPQNEIVDITVMKKGMTNRSFLFVGGGAKYIIRIPGEGTDQLINRGKEAEVYRVISNRDICDDIIYINPNNGYKITKFMENTRVCNPLNVKDISKCMAKLRKFHEMELIVDHEFDIFGQIEFYESLWNNVPSVYKDYNKTKSRILSLKPYIDNHVDRKVLTHIDAVPDNFLIKDDEVRLIDWEYSGMQDPHVDIAMFCIYSLYNKRQVDRLINIYFEGNCPNEIRIKIYCYIASCGLLWSNWCEYKRILGVEFGEYAIRQYRYAKDYYKIVQNELNKIREVSYA
jgi:CTP:phosphocholine cytidylyltransferase-like protein/thiamine kinase-like enzyme